MKLSPTSFIRHNEGATIIEFAIVAPVFFLIIFAIVEYGLIQFSQVAIEGALMQSSRSASIGAASGGCDRVCTIRALVQQKTLGLIGASQVTVAANTVAAGGAPPAPDICLTTPDPTTPAVCPAGTPFQDNNANGRYDNPANLSLGGAGDLVQIRVSYPWKVQVPMLKNLIGQNGVLLISATTVVKNEPF